MCESGDPKKGKEPTPQEYCSWFDSELQATETYHNHKEAMAWTATAFYLPLVIVLGYKACVFLSGVFIRVVFSLLVLLLGYMVLVFVHMQFQMRWKAAQQTLALRRLRGRLTATNTWPDELDCAVRDGAGAQHTCFDEIPTWPAFVVEEIRNCNVQRNLRCALWNLVRPRHWNEVEPALRTELPSYGVILMATIIAILMPWYSSGRKLGSEKPISVQQQYQPGDTTFSLISLRPSVVATSEKRSTVPAGGRGTDSINATRAAAISAGEHSDVPSGSEDSNSVDSTQDGEGR